MRNTTLARAMAKQEKPTDPDPETLKLARALQALPDEQKKALLAALQEA